MIQEKLEELSIPVITLEAGKKAHIVRYLLTKKLRSIVQYRHSMFERVYTIKPKLAEKLLATGYKQISRFGRWCPVKVCVLAELSLLQVCFVCGFIQLTVVWLNHALNF